jgi:hypothetical protein
MKRPVIYFSAALLMAAACAQSERNPSESKSDEVASASAQQEPMQENSSGETYKKQRAIDLLTSFAAEDTFSDSLHRFVRKASLSFTTKDLLATTVGIEDLVREQKGYIEHSGMRNEAIYSERVALSNEEELQTSKIRPTAELRVRVPVAGLDTFLRALHPFVKQLHYRNVETENIAFETLLSRLQRGRIQQHSERTLATGDSPDAKALDQLLEREMQADRNLVNELKTEERVQYASVSLSISGTEYLVRERLPLPDNGKYEPSFWSKAGSSVSTGWGYLTGLVVLLLRIWPLLLLLGAGWWGYKRYRRNAKNIPAANNRG